MKVQTLKCLVIGSKMNCGEMIFKIPTDQNRNSRKFTQTSSCLPAKSSVVFLVFEL